MDRGRNRRIYEGEFRDWLPKDVLDFHIHVWPGEAFPAKESLDPRSIHGYHAGGYTVAQCLRDAAEILPEQRFHGVFFGTPDRATDRAASNAYVMRTCDNAKSFGLALVGPEDPVGELRPWFAGGGLVGYKPYHNLVRAKKNGEVGIHDMLPAGQMTLADELGLIVMLHIPRRGRLADPDNQREILELADRYPNARIVLAHIGRAYYLKCIVGQLDHIRRRPNVYVDLAMLNHWEVLEYLFRNFPRERILFGTDMPVSCLGGKSVEINDQYAYVVEEDLNIGSMIHDARGVVDFTYFYYEELRAIRKAAEKAGMSRGELEAVFFGNGMRLLRETLESLRR